MPSSNYLSMVLLEILKQDNAEQKVKAFFEFLKKHNLLVLLPNIYRRIAWHQQQENDGDTLTVVSRYPLSDDEFASIVSITGAENPYEVKRILDDSIIGSFQASYQGALYDASLRHVTEELYKDLA